MSGVGGTPLRVFASWITQAAAKLTGMQGDYPALVEPKYSFGIQAADLEQPEYWTLRGGRRNCYYGASPAVAAKFSFCWLGTAGTELGPLIVVERIRVVGGAAMDVRIGLAIATPPGAVSAQGQGFGMDDRNIAGTVSGPGLGLMQLGNANAAAYVTDETARASLTPGQEYVGPWILSGRLGLYVLGQTANTALNVTFYTRERNAPRVELFAAGVA